MIIKKTTKFDFELSERETRALALLATRHDKVLNALEDEDPGDHQAVTDLLYDLRTQLKGQI